jgi:hypothetical protein
MNPTRWTLLLAIGTVSLGVVVGGAAYFSAASARAQNGAWPESLDWIPDSASLVGFLDVRALASSPLSETLSREWKGHEAPDEIYARAGIDVFRDVDAVLFSVSEGKDERKRDRWGLVATGGFDAESVARRLAEGDAEGEEYRGARIYRLGGESGSASSAVVEGAGSTLLFGEDEFLREMIDAGRGVRPRATGLLASFPTESLDGATFWAAGSASKLGVAALGGATDDAPLESFVLSARLDAELELQARGRARDADSAQKLADVLRGLVALGRLQKDGGGSELANVADAVSIEVLEREIDVGLRVPYETLRKLSERPPKPPQLFE